MSISIFQRPWNNLGEKLSISFFICLFPGFFLYHYAVAALSVPPFLGGLFGFISVAAAIMFLPLWLGCLVRLRKHALCFFLTVAALYILVAYYLVAHYFLGADYQSNTDVVFQVGSTIIMWFSLFMIGFYWPEKGRLFQFVLILSLVLMGVIIVSHLDANLMFYTRRLWGVEEVATYQGFARSVAFTGIALLSSMVLNPRRYWVTVGVLCCLLFFCGARSEFIGFLLIFPLVLWLGPRRSVIWWPVATLVFICLLVIILANIDVLSASRQLQFINPETWTSLYSRLELQRKGVEGIISSPVFGDYAGHIRNFGSTGSYIHNVLSAWRQFGLMGFLLYFGLTGASLWIAFCDTVFRGHRDAISVMALYCNAFCFILIVAAKSVFWPPVALGWGLAVALLVRTLPNVKNHRISP